MSRKSILVFVAVLAAILGVVGTEFGLALNGPAAAAGLGAILLYVFFEAKADKERLRAQSARWSDPKFWMTVVSAVIAALGTSGVVLPISPEVISGILALIVGLLFKKAATA